MSVDPKCTPHTDSKEMAPIDLNVKLKSYETSAIKHKRKHL